ncbi:hypothetical protein KBA41_07425 [Candidatus Ozemobacteraceae bacterium]|nr:hypothetical protein [Candidatus Ozemobacteraceae bacterium]
MNSEWMEKNKRALVGLAIFAILLLLNFITYSRRAKPAAAPIAVTAVPGTQPAGTSPVSPAAAVPTAPAPQPGTPSPAPVSAAAPAGIPAPSTGAAPAALPGQPFAPDPTQPIGQLLSGISNTLTDMETRLATVPLPITRVILHESFASTTRDLFHWPGSEIVIPPPPLPTGTEPIVQPASQSAKIVYLGSITRGTRKFALVRVDSRAFMIESGAGLPSTEFLMKQVASRSIDLEAPDGKSRNIPLHSSQSSKVDEIVELLKNKPDRTQMEIRWFPLEGTASGTASPTAGAAGLTSTGRPR